MHPARICSAAAFSAVTPAQMHRRTALSEIDLECDQSQVFRRALSQGFKKHSTAECGYHGNFRIRSGKNIGAWPK
jgi:hypothetical protein